MEPVVIDDSFESVFHELYPRARGVALRILGDVPSAEDAAAEAFARALVRWTTVAALPYRDAWILRVTANAALDVAREQSRLRDLSVAECGETDGPEELVVLRRALVAALIKLPKRQRDAVVLSFLVGMSASEAAEYMGVSPSSMRQYLRRALINLRRRLGDGEADWVERNLADAK